MVYGRTARLYPLMSTSTVNSRTHKYPESYVAQLQRHHQLARETVEATLTAAQSSQKRNYDTRATTPYKYNSGGGAGGQRGQLPLQLEDQQLRRNFGRKIFEFSYSSMAVFTRTINAYGRCTL